jgi:hypothetical protein
MDSLSVGIPVPSIDCDGETWTRVNTDLRDDLFFPDALFLSGGGWPGSDWNGGRHQIGMPAAIKSEYLAALHWNPQLRMDAQSCARSMRFSPLFGKPAEWDDVVARSLDDYRSGRSLMDHLGADRLIDPALTGTLLAIRRGPDRGGECRLDVRLHAGRHGGDRVRQCDARAVRHRQYGADP